CLTGLVVSPCGARVEFSVGHYIVVSSPSGGAAGRVLEGFRIQFLVVRDRFLRRDFHLVGLDQILAFVLFLARQVYLVGSKDLTIWA
ncbi:MAG: hypothetical protein ABR915_21485, partial [Thermoguttaceae bacterium]